MAWPQPGGSGGRSAARQALAFLASLLYPKYRMQRSAEGGEWYSLHEDAFMFPPEDKCMEVDPRQLVKVNREVKPMLVRYRPAPYLVVRLTAASGMSVYEGAHRLLMWAMKGPPPITLVDPVVMHVCHNGGCLNPRHMNWAERAANLVDQPARMLKGIPQ